MRKWDKKKKTAAALAAAVFLVIFPFAGLSDYLIRVAIMLMIYIIAALGLNMISGEAGQVSMGQAGFFAVGAYGSALLSLKLGLPVILCMVFAALITGLVSAVLGILALRLSGGYLAVITLALSEAIRLIIVNWSSLTNGNVGLVAIPRPKLGPFMFQGYTEYYFMTLLFLILAVLASRNIIRSSFGLRLKMIKNDEIVSQTSGVNILREKVIAFTISGLFAGLSGALYAHLMRFIEPSVGANVRSNLFLCMVVLGGMGNMYGTIAAAVLLGILPELLRGFDALNQLIYGLILIVAMLFKAKNISLESIKARLSVRRAGKLE